MHIYGETWLRILLLLCTLIVSVSCLRGSELVLLASKTKQAAVSSNTTETQGEISDAEGTNNTTKEKSLLTGIPQIDYIHDPNLPRELNGFNLSDYPFYNAIPTGIEFKCDGLHDGFYASVPHHCQVYHHCLYGIRYDFLCANYTAFDQKTFICHFVSEVDCNNSPKYYQRNEALYKQTTAAPVVIKTTTTKATTQAPPKKEEDVRRPGPYRHRRPPFRRRPAYEYYDNGDDYYDDYYYYGPPVRKRPNRNKGYRGDYYGGERAGGHKSIQRDPSRRKPLKPLYEEDDEEYEYYYDSADSGRDDDDRRRPLDNNYRKPSERERLYQNKKREKDNNNRYEGGLRNDKKKRVEEEYLSSRKSEDDKRLRNKYLNKGFASRSKFDRDEDDFDYETPRRNQEEKRNKHQKNKSSSESPKRVTEEKPIRSKFAQKTTYSPSDEEEYDDIAVTPKWKNRFQANPRRPPKEDSHKKNSNSKEDSDDSTERKSKSDQGKGVSEVTEASVSVGSINPSIYARQPSKLYSQVKVETRPPPVQRNKDSYKSDVPATTMSSKQRRPLNSRPDTKAKEKVVAETERSKPLPKYTTPSSYDDEEYEDDTAIDNTAPAKSYYEEDISDTYLNEQFPSKSAPTIQQPSKNVKEQTPTDAPVKLTTQRSKGTNTEPRFSSFNQRFKPVTERQTSTFLKQQTTEKQPIEKPPATENQFLPYPKQPLEESQTLSYFRQVADRQPLNAERQPQIPEKQSFSPERQSFSPERQSFSPERQSFTPGRQSFSPERHSFTPERQSFSPERQSFNSERQAFSSERQPFSSEGQTFNSERQAFSAERLPYSVDRQVLGYSKQPITERQPLPQIPLQRQPFVERQPVGYSKQTVTERLFPYQKQPITTERQVISYGKLPVTDRQLIPFKQVVTDRQIIPFIRQTEPERKPVPFPKQPPRTFEITAPGPSGLGSRIEVSDSIPRGKYVIQSDRPTGFSLRLPQNDYSNPLPPSTQIQRRPEEHAPEKTVTRPPFKPVRSYRAKPTPEPQYHDSVRLDSFPQRYLSGTEEYEPIVLPNSRLPGVPQIAHVTSSKEWYW